MRVLAVVSLVLFLLAQPAVSQVPDDKLIVPGQRIGKWTLDMTVAELVKMNGKPESGSAAHFGANWADGMWAYEWYFPSILRAFAKGPTEQRIVALSAWGGAYKTAKGVGPTSGPRQIEAAYGKPTAVMSLGGGASRLIYDKIGLFAVPGFIGVFRPGTAKTIWTF